MAKLLAGLVVRLVGDGSGDGNGNRVPECKCVKLYVPRCALGYAKNACGVAAAAAYTAA